MRQKNVISKSITNIMEVENKNVFSTISSSNYKEKYKEWKSSVCHGFVTRITLLKKSMIPTTLKHQNWVEPLSGSKSSKFLNN